MDESEIKLLLDGIAEKNGTAIREHVKAETQKLWGVVDAQGMEIRKVSSGGFHDASQALTRIVSEQQKNILALASGERRSIKFSVPMTVNKAQVTRASVSGSTMAMTLPIVGQMPYMGTVLSGLFRHAPVSPSSNGVIRYYDQNAIVRGATAVAEGATKPESSISWIERTCKIEKVADSIPVTKEALSDVYFIEGEIRRLLEINLALKVDDLLYDGDGVTPNLKGVWTSSPVFNTAGYADTIEMANIYDLIAVVATDISNNRQAKYKANIALLNPVDTLGMKTIKNVNGNYIIPPFAVGYTNVEGIQIVESSEVTPNTMVVGDFRYGTIYDLEDVVIEMGWINDQFIKNALTILAEQRLALLIRVVDETAFRKVTDITTALADIETP